MTLHIFLGVVALLLAFSMLPLIYWTVNREYWLWKVRRFNRNLEALQAELQRAQEAHNNG